MALLTILTSVPGRLQGKQARGDGACFTTCRCHQNRWVPLSDCLPACIPTVTLFSDIVPSLFKNSFLLQSCDTSILTTISALFRLQLELELHATAASLERAAAGVWVPPADAIRQLLDLVKQGGMRRHWH
jgi:hypothetical protein